MLTGSTILITCTFLLQESMWVTVRKMIRWQPFMQNYKREYPWIQLAGHAGRLVMFMARGFFLRIRKVQVTSFD